MTDDFQKMIKFDSLQAAQGLTGEKYTEDEDTRALGFLLHMENTKRLQDELFLRDDTVYSGSFKDSLRIVQDTGFTILSDITFPGRYTEEHFVILWRAGVIVTVESHTWSNPDEEPHTNSIQVYGNWLPNEGTSPWSYTASGHFTREGGGYDNYPEGDPRLETDPWVWVGHWSGSVAFRNLMDRLDNAGTWLETWVDDPWLWLVTYNEREPEGERSAPGVWMEERTAEKTATFPPDIRDMIKAAKAKHEEKSARGKH